MDLLLSTVLLRPYVFIFLAIYLLGASLQWGYRIALMFLPVGYVLAFFSEFSSIHWGFPYGHYYYIPTTVNRELWVMGVPFMDSISYVFLAACSYGTAIFLWCPFTRGPQGVTLWNPLREKKPWGPWLLGSILMVLLDIMIDPVALRGDRWFLGKIYAYPFDGAYFGVPLSNFAGWLLVALVLIRVLQGIERLWKIRSVHPRWKGVALVPLWGPILYLGILGFNLGITFHIGEITVGIVGTFLAGTLLVMGGTLTLYKIRHPFSEEDLEVGTPRTLRDLSLKSSLKASLNPSSSNPKEGEGPSSGIGKPFGNGEIAGS